MGSAASTLSPEDKVKITQEIKKTYEQAAASHSDDLQKIITTKFCELTKKPSDPTEMVSPIKRAVNAPSSLAKSLPGERRVPGKIKHTRRRSFDKESAPTKGVSPIPPDEEGVSAAGIESPVKTVDPSNPLPTVPENCIDSWDSVAEQPYCALCKMAFKSPAFLDRHVKFSTIHADNLKKSTEDPHARVIPLSALPSPSTSISLKEKLLGNIAKQEEGKHYRLLYSGTKFFWRFQQALDIDIYHHILSHCVEIIGFNPTTHKELARLYLDFDVLFSNIKPDLKAALAEYIQINGKFDTVLDEKKVREEILVQKMNRHMLHRINLDMSRKALEASGLLGVMEFLTLTGDDDKPYPVLEEPPVTLVPVQITRRRKSSSEEFFSTVNDFNNDCAIIDTNVKKASDELTAAEGILNKQPPVNPRALHIAHFVYEAARIIIDKKLYKDDKNVNKYKKLWIRAIDKVILMNMVPKTRQYLSSHNNVFNIKPRKKAPKPTSSLLNK